MNTAHLTFSYNDAQYVVELNGSAWDICRTSPHGAPALLASRLFEGLPAEQALVRAQAVVHEAAPAGVKLVGPDVAHPIQAGDLKIVGPNVGHPQFARWTTDSVSFAQAVPPAAKLQR